MRAHIASLLLLAACARESGVDLGGGTITKRMASTNMLDLLFVIDDSASTSDKQTVFAQNFPRFVQALDAFPIGRPDLHIGVVTTSVDLQSAQGTGCPSPNPNNDGALVNAARVTAGCTPPNGHFISDVSSSGGRTTNYSGTLADAFSCIAQVGANGCGFEAPLEAIKRALGGGHPDNAGFLRDGAYLGIIILTDEDDASLVDNQIFMLGSAAAGPGDFRAQPLYAYTCDHPITADQPDTYYQCKPRKGSYLTDVDSYFPFLSALKPPSQTFVALIAGDPSPTIATGAITTPFSQSMALLPSCTATINGNPTLARPAIRLDAFRQAYEPYGNGAFYSVCQSDYSAALTDIGAKLYGMMSPCLQGAFDTTDRDAHNPGIQPSCVAVERAAGQPDVTLVACRMLDATTPDPSDTHPCWWLLPNDACTTDSKLSVQLEHVSADPNATTDFTCARQ